jgi:hypothetical protein
MYNDKQSQKLSNSMTHPAADSAISKGGPGDALSSNMEGDPAGEES